MSGRATPESWSLDGSDVARRIRERDWEATPLGPIDGWPQSLRTAVEACLGCAFPAALVWGPGLTLICNDAFTAARWSPDAEAIAQPAPDALGIAWKSLEPHVAAALTTGSAPGVQNMHVSVDEGERSPPVQLAVSFSPLALESGETGGVLVIAVETGSPVSARSESGTSEEYLQTLFESVDQGLCIIEVAFDDTGRAMDYSFLETNPSFERNTGLSGAIGRRIRDMSPNLEEHWFEAYGRVALTGNPERFEAEAAPLGRWFSVSAIRVGEPEQHRVAILFEDITARRSTEVALRESEERLQRLVNIEGVGVLLFEMDGTLIRANDYFLDVTGYSRQTIARRQLHWRDLTPPEYVGESEEQLRQLAAAGRSGPYEKEYLRADGSRLWMLFAGATLPDNTFVKYCLDISDRKRAEAAARTSEQRLHSLVRNIVDYAIFMLDADGRVTEWTEGAEQVTGYTAGEVIGQHASLFYLPEAQAAGDPERVLADAAAAGRAERETWRVRKGGERYWANEIATAIRNDAGNLVGFTQISRDLTERRRSEEEIREREERFRAIVEEATDYAVFTADANGRIDGWYAGAQAVFGHTAAEAIGMPMEVTYRPEDRAAGVPEQERTLARERGVAPNVRWHVRRDGSRVFIDGVARARFAADGTFQGVLKIGRDVTERRLARQRRQDEEERVRHELARQVEEATAELRLRSRRLLLVQEEERRRLALELHDDFGQMLTGLGLTLGTGELNAARLDEALRIVDELTERIRQRSTELRPATLDSHGLLPALRWHLERYRRQTGIPVDLLQEGLDRRFPPAVEIAAYRIVQEALTNAARHAGTDHVVVQLYADDVALTVSVRDHGRGFDPSTITRGAGLGGMQERTELLGGTFEIDAAPGQGVTLTAELPLTATVLDGRDEVEA